MRHFNSLMKCTIFRLCGTFRTLRIMIQKLRKENRRNSENIIFETHGIFYAKLLDERTVHVKGRISAWVGFCLKIYIFPTLPSVNSPAINIK